MTMAGITSGEVKVWLNIQIRRIPRKIRLGREKWRNACMVGRCL